ncbi:hypothetical protein GGR09_000573 [Bartonella heixiaziensis]
MILGDCYQNEKAFVTYHVLMRGRELLIKSKMTRKAQWCFCALILFTEASYGHTECVQKLKMGVVYIYFNASASCSALIVKPEARNRR